MLNRESIPHCMDHLTQRRRAIDNTVIILDTAASHRCLTRWREMPIEHFSCFDTFLQILIRLLLQDVVIRAASGFIHGRSHRIPRQHALHLLSKSCSSCKNLLEQRCVCLPVMEHPVARHDRIRSFQHILCHGTNIAIAHLTVGMSTCPHFPLATVMRTAGIDLDRQNWFFLNTSQPSRLLIARPSFHTRRCNSCNAASVSQRQMLTCRVSNLPRKGGA